MAHWKKSPGSAPRFTSSKKKPRPTERSTLRDGAKVIYSGRAEGDGDRVHKRIAAHLIFLAACNSGGKIGLRAERRLIEVAPAALDFGTVALGTTALRTTRLLNPGAGAVTVRGVSLSGPHAAVFTIVDAVPFVIAGTDSAPLTVSYAPTATGTDTARVTIRSDAANAPELYITVVAAATDGCTELVCNTPPAPACAGDKTLVAYSAPGRCTAGICSYTPVTSTCADGCATDHCATDLCRGVVCNAPPPCFTGGICVGGACQYHANLGAPCDLDDSCAIDTRCSPSGRCVGQTKSCPPPPPLTCADGVLSFFSAGLCTHGTCSYAPHQRICATPEQGRAICDGNTCGFVCNTGFAPVHGACRGATTTP